MERESFVRRVGITLGITTLFVFAFLAIFYAGQVLLVAFAGFLLAVYFRGLGVMLGRWIPVPKRALVGAVLLVHVGLTVLFAWYAAPLLKAQAEELVTQLPTAIDRLRQLLEGTAWGGPVLESLPDPETITLGTFQDFGVFSSGLSAIVDVVVILIVGVYGALEPETYRRGFLLLLPPAHRLQAAVVTDESVTTLRHLILGLFASATVIGVSSSVGLALLGVPLPMFMGVLAAVLTFIPNIGPLIAVAPPALLALLNSPRLAMWVLVLYGVLQVLESYVITPLIQRRAVKLPPALLILAQVLLGVVAGPLGIALAAPLAALGISVGKTLYVKAPDQVPTQQETDAAQREPDDSGEPTQQETDAAQREPDDSGEPTQQETDAAQREPDDSGDPVDETENEPG